MGRRPAVLIGAPSSRLVAGFALGGALWSLMTFFAFGWKLAAGVAALSAIFTLLWAHSSRKAFLFAETLPQVKCRRGYIEYYRILTRRYKATVSFTPTGGESAAPPEPGEYAVVSNGKDLYIRAAGCIVEEGRFKGLLVALLDPSAARTLSEELAASTEHGDYASAVVRPVGPGQVEVLLEAHLAKARAARLILAAKTPRSVHAATLTLQREYTVLLAESRGGAVREVVDLRGFGEPTLLVISGISKFFYGAEVGPGIAGLGPGPAYRLRLVLDVPHARDVVVEKDVVPLSETGLRNRR